MKSILKQLNILNLILFAAAVAVFFALVFPLLEDPAKINVPRLKEIMKKGENAGAVDFHLREYLAWPPDRFLHPFRLVEIKVSVWQDKIELFEQEKVVIAESAPTSLDYIIVTEKNLFHPERKAPSGKKDESQIARPEVIYYGSIITSEKRIAYIEDKKNPYATPGRGKRQTAVVQGVMIGGYKLTEVNPENIVLVRGDDRMVVNLRDEKDRKAPETATGKRPAQTSATALPSPPKQLAPSAPQRPSVAPSMTPSMPPSTPSYPAQKGTGPIGPQRPTR